MKTYHGTRGAHDTRMVRVLVADSAELLAVVEGIDRPNRGSGFDWGVNNPGAAELALAILADFKNPQYARAWYLIFKSEVIARLPPADFSLDEEQIAKCMKWIAAGDGVPRHLLPSEGSHVEPLGAMVQALSPEQDPGRGDDARD